MISSKIDYFNYLKADEFACVIPQCGKKRIISWILDPRWRFQRLLRKTEYYTNCHKTPLGKVYSLYLRGWRLPSYGRKLGYSIPINTIGPGLCLVHTGTIVISPHAKIGKNFRCHVCVNIGCSKGGGRRVSEIMSILDLELNFSTQ